MKNTTLEVKVEKPSVNFSPGRDLEWAWEEYEVAFIAWQHATYADFILNNDYLSWEQYVSGIPMMDQGEFFRQWDEQGREYVAEQRAEAWLDR